MTEVKQIGALALILVLFWKCSNQKQEVADLNSLFLTRKKVNSHHVSMPYRIMFPEGYKKSERYPLVFFLHGGGERGIDNEKQLTYGASLFASQDNRTKFPCIMLVPQCPEEGYWASANIDRSVNPYPIDFDYTRSLTPPMAAAMEILDNIITTEYVDTSRIYIIGLSMGGLGTFEAVYKQPDTFAAAVPICGGGDTTLYTLNGRSIPFWIFHGEKDKIIDVNYSRAMAHKLNSLSVPVQYTEYAGVKHNSWENAFAEPALLPWLFSQRKNDIIKKEN